MLAAIIGGMLSLGTQTAPSVLAQPAQQLFIQADTVLGSKNLTRDELTTKVCVQQSRFARNEEIVWRIRVMDPKTGKSMDDTALASVTVEIPGGVTLNAGYGGHPGGGQQPTDFFWATTWLIPATYPTGTLSYRVVAVGRDNRRGEFIPFNVGPSLLTIMPEVRHAP
jgi:hypothetical protein